MITMPLSEYKKLHVKKKPRPLERDITKAIREYLNIKKIHHWKNWAGLGSTKGVPDILGVLPGGRSFMIEVKTPEGEVSPHQKEFIEEFSQQGALVFVARSVEDVMERGI